MSAARGRSLVVALVGGACLLLAPLLGCPPVEPPLPIGTAGDGGDADGGRPPFAFEAEPSANVEACERYEEAVAALPCGSGADVGCASFASVGCDLEAFFTCAAGAARCEAGALDTDAVAACEAPVDCPRDNAAAAAACHAWRAVQEALGCEGGFSEAACEAAAKTPCDATGLFRCLAAEARCEDGAWLDDLRRCAEGQGCVPPAVQSALACEDWQQALGALPCTGEGAGAPSFDCGIELVEPCDRSEYFACLESGYTCEGARLVPDVERCAALARCASGPVEEACRDWAQAANACAAGSVEPTACARLDEATCDAAGYFRCLERSAVCSPAGVVVDAEACADQSACPQGARSFEGCEALAGRAAELGCASGASALCRVAMDRPCDDAERYACLAGRASCGPEGLVFDDAAASACAVGACAALEDANFDACESFRVAAEACVTEPEPLAAGACAAVRTAPCALAGAFACHLEHAQCGEQGLIVDREACRDAAPCSSGLEDWGACREKNAAVAALGCEAFGEDEEACDWLVGSGCRYEEVYDCLASAFYCGPFGLEADPGALELCDALEAEACPP